MSLVYLYIVHPIIQHNYRLALISFVASSPKCKLMYLKLFLEKWVIEIEDHKRILTNIYLILFR